MDLGETDLFHVTAEPLEMAGDDRLTEFSDEQCDKNFSIDIMYNYMTYREDEDDDYLNRTTLYDTSMVFHQHLVGHAAAAAITGEEIITWINTMGVVLPDVIMEEAITKVRDLMQMMIDQMQRGLRTSLALNVDICVSVMARQDEARSVSWIPPLIDNSNINEHMIATEESWEEQAMAESMEMSFVKAKQPASLEAIKKLEIVEITELESSVNQNCVVCIDMYHAGLKVTKMPCGHLFHTDCILSWLQEACSCPICRSELPPPTSPCS